MKGCGTPGGVHAGSLAGPLLLVRLRFLLPPGVALWMIRLCSPGSCQPCELRMSIASLRIFMGHCHANWLRFHGMMTFLLASCMFGLGA